MRVAVVVGSRYRGGAERYLVTLYTGLQRRGHQPTLIGQMPGWDGIPATEVSLGPKWAGRKAVAGVVRLPVERKRIEAILAQIRPDLIHMQFKREQIGFTRLLANYAPVVWTEHGTFPRGRLRPFLAAGYRNAARFTKAIICVSTVVADDLRGIVGEGPRLLALPNAIDVSAIRVPTEAERLHARAALGIPVNTAPVLAWVGQMHSGKLPILAAKVGREFGGFTVLAGEGELARSVVALADGYRVRAVGYRADPGAVYRAADVFLFTSAGRGEGYPTNTLLEASAYGLPVVANLSSGIGDSLRAAGGLVGADDPAGLARLAERAWREVPRVLPRRYAEDHDLLPWLRRHERIFELAMRKEGGLGNADGPRA